MKELLLDIFLTVVESLRRWWRRLAGASPRVVPVPIRVQPMRFSHLRELDDHRSPTDIVCRWGGR